MCLHLWSAGTRNELSEQIVPARRSTRVMVRRGKKSSKHEEDSPCTQENQSRSQRDHSSYLGACKEERESRFGLVATQAHVLLWTSHVSKELQADFTEAEKQQQSHLPACGPDALLHFPLAACCESGVVQAKPSILRFFPEREL